MRPPVFLENIMQGTTNNFSLGQIVYTPAAEAALGDEFPSVMRNLLSRHTNCDWGDLCEEDKEANNHAVNREERILSSYNVERGGTNVKVWVITEWDRSVTTVLLPSDY